MDNLRQLPKIRDSLSFTYFEHARIEKEGNAIAVFDGGGETHVPAAALATIMLGPGSNITHAAVKLLADVGCSILWVGEGGDRVYGQGMGETRSSRRFLRQAALHADSKLRAAVVLKMYQMRFDEPLPDGLTIEQVRGREGVRVRQTYAEASKAAGVEWTGRKYKRGDWHSADRINRAISAASACLNGVCHAAVVSAGYSTALGFVHTGKMLSFVYDVSDLYRMDIAVPVAFEVTSQYKIRTDLSGFEKSVRIECREAFREHKLMQRIVKDIDTLMTISEKDVERSSSLFDGADDAPGLLWDPETGEIKGGINYADDNIGEPAEEPKG